MNEFTVKNAATGNAPQLQATGGDTNIDVNVVPKGTGKLKQNGTAVALSGANADITSMSGLTGALKAPTQIEDSNGNEELKFASVASAINEFTVKNAASGNAPELQATGGDTNVDIKLVPKGTGKVLSGSTPLALSGANADITSLIGLTGALKAPTEIQDSGGLKVVEFGAGDDGEHLKIGTISNVPTLEAVGSSANVGIDLKTKGTGQVTVNGSPIGQQNVTVIIKPSDESRSNTTTPALDTDLQFVVAPGKKYAFEFLVRFLQTGSGPNFKFSIQGTGGSTGFYTYVASVSQTTLSDATGLNGDVSLTSIGSAQRMLRVTGFVWNTGGSNATFGFAWSQNSSSATSVRVTGGSWLNMSEEV